MSRRDRPPSGTDEPATSTSGSASGNSLLGDLESIRTLLDEGAARASSRAASRGKRDEPGDVPMLDDVVEGALSIEENTLAGRAFEDDAAGTSALADEAIATLMGDEWRESADRIIRSARRAIRDAARELSDDDTRSLDRQLRARIDAALNDWMAEITLHHIDDLRERLLDALGDEVRRITDALREDDTDAP